MSSERSGARIGLVIAVVSLAVAGISLAAWAYWNWDWSWLALEGNTTPIACDEFEFSREDWFDRPKGGWGASGTVTERERIASAFYRCGTLHNKPRAQVEAMIGHGRAGKDPRRVIYEIGWVNDAIGPGDGWTMTVVYDERDRVANFSRRQDHPYGVN